MSPHSHHPPGTRPPRRFRPRLHWELVICSLRGHALVGRYAAALRAQDAIFAREDAAGVRWFRCLRCDSWLPLPAPERTAEEHPPSRERIELPVLLFAADRATLRETFYKVITDLQGGVAANQSHAHGILHEIDNAFTTSSSHLHLVGAVLLVYGVVEGIEAVGLWYQRRWAEYLTFLVTASLLPLEIYELANRATVFKAIAFVINVAVVVYLLRAKRLFGLRGGVAADHAEAAIDQGWEALERTAPPVAATTAVAPAVSAS